MLECLRYGNIHDFNVGYRQYTQKLYGVSGEKDGDSMTLQLTGAVELFDQGG